MHSQEFLSIHTKFGFLQVKFTLNRDGLRNFPETQMTTTIEYILLYVIVFEIFVKTLNREKVNWISNGIFDLVVIVVGTFFRDSI